jgi:hypothetical protein
MELEFEILLRKMCHDQQLVKADPMTKWLDFRFLKFSLKILSKMET